MNAMWDFDELARRVDADLIDTVICAFPDLYGRLMGKRFEAGYFLDAVAQQGTHACDYLLTTDMEMEPVQGYSFANWNTGYGDFHLLPDSRTLRPATWLEGTAIVLCDVHDDATHQLVPQAPRTILRRQVEAADEMGFAAYGGSEVEYYVFRDSYGQAREKRYHRLQPAGDYIEDYHILQASREEPLNRAARRHLTAAGIPVECTKGEWGMGQHELNLKYTDVLEMADRHTVYKQCMKELADSQGWSVTFMAKHASDQAGSSCHVHVSLWNDDRNAFSGSAQMGAISCSDTFRWFLAGWMAHASELMVCYAPTVNSYKRYRSGSWAPTRLAWAHDNRTAGFRVVGRCSSLRVECRIPGADCNPYLVYAAALASGLDGIRNQLEPPDPCGGDVYHAESQRHVPNTLRDAIDLFERSRFARDVFGGDVVEHYLHFLRTEQEAYDRAVTDWERLRYFERI